MFSKLKCHHFSKKKGRCSEDSSTENGQSVYFDIQDHQVPIIYSPHYDIHFMGLEKLHPFDSAKWGKIFRFLEEELIITSENVVEPVEASDDDLMVVHTPQYLEKLKWSPYVATITEVPCVAAVPNSFIQRSVLRPFRYQTGGSILAGKLAIERKWAINIGGGFHHCCADRGGGFCAYADISLCVHFLFNHYPDVSRVMIVDLDAHQGNGYETDFVRDERVYILDVYNRFIYPHDDFAKLAISRDIGLKNFVQDAEYLEIVAFQLNEALQEFHADIIIYNAGTDILRGDPLGNLSISPEGIIARDELVFDAARRVDVPIIMLTSGGYQKCTARIIADSIVNLHTKGYLHKV